MRLILYEDDKTVIKSIIGENTQLHANLLQKLKSAVCTPYFYTFARLHPKYHSLKLLSPWTLTFGYLDVKNA